MVDFQGTHTHRYSGRVYTFVGEATFTDPLVRWQAKVSEAGADVGAFTGVVGDVPMASETRTAAVQGVELYIDSNLP